MLYHPEWSGTALAVTDAKRKDAKKSRFCLAFPRWVVWSSKKQTIYGGFCSGLWNRQFSWEIPSWTNQQFTLFIYAFFFPQAAFEPRLTGSPGWLAGEGLENTWCEDVSPSEHEGLQASHVSSTGHFFLRFWFGGNLTLCKISYQHHFQENTIPHRCGFWGARYQNGCFCHGGISSWCGTWVCKTWYFLVKVFADLSSAIVWSLFLRA